MLDITLEKGFEKHKTKGLKIFNIQRTCVYDGPGLRTTIFFRGCGLRCLWCQNPEGQSFETDKVNDPNYTLDEIMELILRDKAFYDTTGGGVTLSGGEPLLQDSESLIQLLKRLKENNISIAVETALLAPWENIEKILPYIDLFFVDFKVVGDDELHYKLTKQKSDKIQSNVEKLIEHNANIKFRMVIVPGYNDDEKNIKATTNRLKELGYDTIEILRYQNFYEEKKDRLGLSTELDLGITPEQSAAAVKQALKLFKSFGINAIYIDIDSSVKKTEFTERVKKIQQDIRDSKRAVCIEAAHLRTKYYRKNGFKKPLPIHRGERLAYILKNKKVKIYPHELLVGNFTSKRVAGQLWEEYYGVLSLLFFYKIDRIKPVPFKCSLKEKFIYYTQIVPFWINHHLILKAYPRVPDFIRGMSRSTELVVGFNNNMAAIAHFIVNFEVLLEKGTSGYIEHIRQVQKEHPENDPNFYEGAIIALKGLEEFGQRYADEIAKMIPKEKDPVRKKELEEMEQICRRVPKYPARTFHEALQSILFIHIAHCLDAYENAVSFGRLDQILYKYYKKDKEEGRITYEKARELLCLFILKVDELILINDGDTFFKLSNLFETLSTDQSVTYGGVDKDGNDATNEVTYMLIDAGELEPLSLDLSARIHENSPPEYLERLAEVYINGCPIPQLVSDKVYIETLMKHYPTTIENARNYSIIGCVEPNASDSHFGNTDCANINLALPFLQALKGQEYDLWNYKLIDHFLMMTLNFLRSFLTFKFFNKFCDKIFQLRKIQRGFYKYKPVKSMEQLLERFQERLNAVARSILLEQQRIERALRENFTTPLSSSLFESCLQSGKDLYEGGAEINSNGIQAVGVTDVADSLYALNEVVFKKKLYTVNEVINAIDNNFKGEKYQKIREALLAVPKFGDDSSPEASEWVNRVMKIYNNALDSMGIVARHARYSAGYYALNVCNRYGKKTPALPSGRLKGQPLANSITPHYGMKQTDLLSTLNAMSRVDFVEHAENGTTATLTIDAALFKGNEGKKKLAGLFKKYLTNGGMQLQPNVINKEILLEAYYHPEKHPYLLVRIAGYCAYFQELSDEMKKIIINRTCYTS